MIKHVKYRWIKHQNNDTRQGRFEKNEHESAKQFFNYILNYQIRKQNEQVGKELDKMNHILYLLRTFHE